MEALMKEKLPSQQERILDTEKDQEDQAAEKEPDTDIRPADLEKNTKPQSPS
jgi:hypothetical protein